MSSTSVTDAKIHYLRPTSPRAVPINTIGQDAALDVSVETLRDVADLEASWKDLEARAAHSFYLSWLWIGTWLRHLPKGTEPHVLIVRELGKIVGLAIVCRRKTWRLGSQARMRWLLNETGDARFDRLFIEYNGILAERASADAITVACLEASMQRLRHSDELVLSGIDPAVELSARCAACFTDLVTDVKVVDIAPWVDFTEVRRKGGDYRATLGRNTRQAVSRSMRLYAERGSIGHLTMETTSEALAAFDELISFHRSRWGRKGPFAHPGFRSFHEDLIARGVPIGAVRISRTLVGDQTIGILYNFVHQGHVLNYQSGFFYEQDGRLKPGLISHVLSIEDSLLRGERGYDFLAGSAGHKSRLANAESSMKWIVIGKDSLERRIEAKVRRARQRLRLMVTH
ncbi:GNAT family N-acetyltransferase [Nitrobacter sp. JJSN]|uniref:GNAT family N-acetyltransferase n=1 Tax=Nitrobacter sp. JJSN TaxID=3453033 RepID=UPI003F759DB2